MNGFGIPNFGGLVIGDADNVLKFKFFGKFKKNLVSLLNVTSYGGYRNMK